MNKVVISGTSKGIGQAIAKKFLESGFEVYGFDLLESSINHPAYHHYVKDIRDKVFPDINPDIIINNAGTFVEKEALDTNLMGTINFTEAFLKQSDNLKSIVFITSASARNGSEFPLYSSSKGGIVTYMKNLALNLAPRGITCNGIAPGGVNNSANEHILSDDNLYSAVLNETLLHKWIEPSEIAELTYYLTVINRIITGEDILIDNGEMLKSNFIW